MTEANYLSWVDVRDRLYALAKPYARRLAWHYWRSVFLTYVFLLPYVFFPKILGALVRRGIITETDYADFTVGIWFTCILGVAVSLLYALWAFLAWEAYRRVRAKYENPDTFSQAALLFISWRVRAPASTCIWRRDDLIPDNAVVREFEQRAARTLRRIFRVRFPWIPVACSIALFCLPPIGSFYALFPLAYLSSRYAERMSEYFGYPDWCLEKITPELPQTQDDNALSFREQNQAGYTAIAPTDVQAFRPSDDQNNEVFYDRE